MGWLLADCRNININVTRPDGRYVGILVAQSTQLIGDTTVYRTSPLQSNLGRARRRPHCLQRNALNSPPKTAPSPSTITTPTYNTPIPRPTTLINRNGIRIQSAVVPQYTFRTDKPTDGIGDSCVSRAHTLYYIDSERRVNNGSLCNKIWRRKHIRQSHRC